MATSVEQKSIDTILQRILAVTQPQRVILFGSAAQGEMSRDSDIDLLILESAPKNPRELTLRIRQSLRGLGYPFDIEVMSAERFEESKNVIGGIAYPANKYGRVIYEAK
jgi:predicted nucleotidyltransferase